MPARFPHRQLKPRRYLARRKALGRGKVSSKFHDESQGYIWRKRLFCVHKILTGTRTSHETPHPNRHGRHSHHGQDLRRDPFYRRQPRSVPQCGRLSDAFRLLVKRLVHETRVANFISAHSCRPDHACDRVQVRRLGMPETSSPDQAVNPEPDKTEILSGRRPELRRRPAPHRQPSARRSRLDARFRPVAHRNARKTRPEH